MKTSFLCDTDADGAGVERLFAVKPPVLVEVRFPKMGTSSDWFLCESLAALEAILERLGPGAELHLNSVWDLRSPAGEIVFRRSRPAGAPDKPDGDSKSSRIQVAGRSPA